MWISKESFRSTSNFDYAEGQQVSDASYYLFPPEDKVHFRKVKFETSVVKPEYDSNPETSLVGQTL